MSVALEYVSNNTKFTPINIYYSIHRLLMKLVSECNVILFKDAIALMKGSGAFGKIKYESGVHRVQRMPETDTTVSYNIIIYILSRYSSMTSG